MYSSSESFSAKDLEFSHSKKCDKKMHSKKSFHPSHLNDNGVKLMY